MSNKRIKVTGCTIRSRTEAEAVLGDIRTITINRNVAMADRERETKVIDDNYRPTLEKLGREIETKSEQLRNWAEANEQEFKGLKSLEMTHGQMGWRIGNPTLKPLTSWTWDRVLERLQAMLKDSPGLSRFIRTKAEVNKQALLDERETLLPDDLRSMGVKVVQEEAFFIEPKLEVPDNRTVLKEAA